MAPPRKHRDALLGSAVTLFRKQGYAATGLAEILEASGAPKGSLYHYFPGGKAEIGAEAVQRAGETVAATLRTLAAEASSPGELLERYLTLLAGWMRKSGYRDGCPITTTLLETVPEHGAIRDAGQAAFAAWAEIIADSARRSGIAPKRAASLARFAIAALEGALIQCRVNGDDTPLKEAAIELRALFDGSRTGRR
ncbi:transcriptional regulator, TetR family [Enhydrobacter aerosaccus]|uniref:Transcriptional regulator, TetR family n=1 Tax=Enhydrobacter aerosaccus TaxID=225324 RepID=A0A1T4JUF6_9HYPH|nr:TetR/AcrR family transcriptional regulator [Enhydrobacter aerosaccus]SJZ33768.1 transcriptional regulator, TetR family [Enhydrobacter aerosaccus]